MNDEKNEREEFIRRNNFFAPAIRLKDYLSERRLERVVYLDLLHVIGAMDRLTPLDLMDSIGFNHHLQELRAELRPEGFAHLNEIVREYIRNHGKPSLEFRRSVELVTNDLTAVIETWPEPDDGPDLER